VRGHYRLRGAEIKRAFTQELVYSHTTIGDDEMRLVLLTLVLGAVMAVSSAAAGQVAIDAAVRLTPDRIGFDVEGRYTNYTLTVAGPQGYHARAEGRRTPPTLRLSDYGETPDGVYSFNLTAATNQLAPQARRVDQSDNGRAANAGAPRIGASLSGHFRVVDGRIRIFDQEEEPSGQGG